LDETVERTIRKHVLANAVKHNGLADVKAVISKVLGERPDLKSNVEQLVSRVVAIVEEVNQIGLQVQLAELRASFPEALATPEGPTREKVLPELRGAIAGKVVTRFPPEPNGYPHIGHAKAAIIGETYARMYDGKFILRFDDTNPAVEKKEFYDAFLSELEWLRIRPDLIKNTSDDIEELYKYAEKLIGAGHIYICKCPPDIVKRNRTLQLECPCRRNGIDENRSLWEKMHTSYAPNEAIARLKVDLTHRNTALRDPTMFRIIDVPHPLLGRKYRVYPTYDFEVPIEDSLDGVTHAMRTKEYELRDELYFLILDLLGLRKPYLIEFSRLEMRGTPVSKRILKRLVQEGIVTGWDDPRMPTLQALRRRGFSPQAIREFIIGMGVKRTESEPTWDMIETLNRRILDPIARRYFFVSDPVRLTVEDAPPVTVTLKYHPDKDLGERRIGTSGSFLISRSDAERFNIRDIFRLLELYNVEVVGRKEGEAIGRYAGNEVKPKLKIQWVTDACAKLEVLVPGPLYLEDQPNPESLKVISGLIEESGAKIPIGEQFQLVRVGFCRLDSKGRAILTHR